MTDAMKTFSIVVPVFNEPGLLEAVPRLLALSDQLTGYKLELVFVDDGSSDDSLAVLLEFQKKHPANIRIAKLTRNFGSMAAAQAGLSLASGDCVGVLAADLQDPPELFLQMIPYWEKGFKTVFAVRSDRDDSAAEKFFSNSYGVLMRKFALSNYPKGGIGFFLVDRHVVYELNQVQEKNTHLMSLILWLGHHHALVPYAREARTQGHSKWTIAKKIKLFIDSFVAFSYLPIRFVSVVGLLFAAAAFLYGAIVFISWAAAGARVEGWTALMIVLTFTAGLQMTMLGVLGEYLWRTLDETRKRPPYVIEQVFDK